jgi:hypothetical protein
MVALADEDNVLDRAAKADYEKAVAALGSGAGPRLVAALSAVNEAARIADETNIPPANVLGWLQVQLRSV